jgi:hypothetical protein
MGPNCNRGCSHCYGNFGSDKKGLPKPRIIQRALDEILKDGILDMNLTDGEPMRHENREVMGLFAEYSKDIPLGIITNGVFARTEKNTLNWLNFLKKSGYELGKDGNRMRVSFGPGYNVHWHNQGRIASGIKKVFPDIDYGKHLEFFMPFIGRVSEDELSHNINKMVSYFFDCDGNCEFEKDEKGGKAVYLFKPNNGGTSIKVESALCLPMGRAENVKEIKKKFPLRESVSDALSFRPDLNEPLYFSSSGDVAFGPSAQCVRPSRIHGNIMKNGLRAIKYRIQDDSIYQAFRLGGVKFLHSLAEGIDSKYSTVSRGKCGVCNSLFEDEEMLGKIKQNIGKGVVRRYRDYIGRILDHP